MVVVSDPAAVRAVFTAPVDVADRRCELDLPRAVRRPELDPRARRARAPAPAQADAAAVPRRPHARAPRPDRRARCGRGRALAAGRAVRHLRRMQALTLDMIMRVVFGAELPELRAAIRRTLDMTMSLPRMLFFSLAGNDLRLPARARAVEAGLRRRSARAAPAAAGGADPRRADRRRLLRRRAARPARHAARGRARDDGRLARLGARAARAPPRGRSRGCATDEPGYADAVVKEVLRTRPVLTIAARKLVAPFTVGRLAAARRRPRRALHLPHPPPPGAVRGPDRVPPRALPRRRRARQLRVDPVRRRRPPLRRRGVRDDGDDRGAAGGRRARDAATGPPGRRADAPAVGHADASSSVGA